MRHYSRWRRPGRCNAALQPVAAARSLRGGTPERRRVEGRRGGGAGRPSGWPARDEDRGKPAHIPCFRDAALQQRGYGCVSASRCRASRAARARPGWPVRSPRGNAALPRLARCWGTHQTWGARLPGRRRPDPAASPPARPPPPGSRGQSARSAGTSRYRAPVRLSRRLNGGVVCAHAGRSIGARDRVERGVTAPPARTVRAAPGMRRSPASSVWSGNAVGHVAGHVALPRPGRPDTG